MQTSESIKEIATALAKAQAAMHGATKDRKNPAFKSDYATLSSVIEAARGPLTENGIAFVQSPGALDDAGVPVTTTLVHSSGEWFKSTVYMPVRDRNNPQAVGSAITYGCRYSLMAMLGLPPVDDDGNAAAQGGPRPNGNGNGAKAGPPVEFSSGRKPAPEPTDEQINAAAKIENAFADAETMEDLDAARAKHSDDIASLPDDLKARLRKIYAFKKEAMAAFKDAAE